MNPSQLRQRYREAHDLVVQAWTNHKPFSFNGRFNQQRYINIWPQPVQKPHPPIWIPGGGSVETWQWCAEMDYVYAYLSYFGYQMGRKTMNGFWSEMDKLGKDRNPYRAAFLQFVGVAETTEEAMKLYKEPAEYFFLRCLHVDPRYATPPGYVTEATMRANIQSQAQAAAGGSRPQAGFQPLTFADMVEKGYVVIGSPDEVADKLKEVATELNVGHLMLLLQFGNMGKDLANENTRLFAQKVAPQLKGLFDDKWEDRWWPKPLPDDARAVPAAPMLRAAE
ncbi:MAG: LLM class flavin-dependent oxidoreductase, partial [Stellaceae bacterium]